MDKLKQVKRTAEEAEGLLLSLVGSWQGTNRTWFKPGELADTSPVRGTIRRLPESRFVIYEYESSVSGEAFHGIMLLGFNEFTGQFEAAWGDSGHQRTNVMFSTGPGLERGFTVLGSYVWDASQPAAGWRIQFELVDEDRLVITMYNHPQGDAEYLGIETDYRRAVA